MRIGWFTPFGVDSAIGRFSAHVVSKLRCFVDVEIWTDSTSELHDVDAPAVTFSPDRLPASVADRFDHAVFNLGDSVAFHAGLLDLARRIDGVIVLHDKSLDSLYAGIAYGDGDMGSYLDAVEFQYGPETRARYARALDRNEPPWDDFEQRARCPLFLDAIAGSRAVVVHSAEHARLVRTVYSNPVCELFLPCYFADVPPKSMETVSSDKRFALLTIGIINRNKGVHHVVEAIAALPEQLEVRYTVAGEFSDPRYRDEVVALVHSLRLEGVVDIVGPVSEDVRRSLLDEADVILVLRHPSLEGGSASLAEGLETGKPVVVYETGAYAALPEGSAVKVSPGDIDGLAAALVKLRRDWRWAQEVGRAGRAHAESLTTEVYVRRLLEFLEEVDAEATTAALAERIARVLGSFDLPRLPGPLTAGAVEQIDDALRPLFETGNRSGSIAP